MLPWKNPGAAAAERMTGWHDPEPDADTGGPAEDHAAHAAGQRCAKCGAEIGADQPARRYGESSWVHDTCP